ncbi:unnamed protein product [Adineta steineri]|uniref:Uncharacterized protein n=1 Tax=Adineta steineri TaxID=433720 RepID=A0A814MS03_9BILA|nr:unnamed protein product [Adineta steineri]CAF3978839.1 unnamed protein product [Adineta steineri]
MPSRTGEPYMHSNPYSINNRITLSENEDESEKDQQTTPPTLFTYKIDISMKSFEVMKRTPSNKIVKFENVNAFLNIKLSLGQLLHTGSFQYAVCFETTLLLKNSLQPADPDREAYFIHLTKPSFYRQPGAINKAGNAKSILENIDESEDDERIKRLEYEHLILGQKIETLKRSQTSYETLKPELARYEWLEKELLYTVKSEISQIMKKQSNKPPQQQQHILTAQQQEELSRRTNIPMV